MNQLSLSLLTVTTLYPSALKPLYGSFVETRLVQMCHLYPIRSQVIAPVPWMPLSTFMPRNWAVHSTQPISEERKGLNIRHPRFLSIPRVAKSIGPISIAIAIVRAARELLESGGTFDVIDAHYFYPDGVAAAIAGTFLDKPVVITARGSDINYFANQPISRWWIKWAARNAAAIITVSDALSKRLGELGVPNSKLNTLRNGVDLDFFTPALNRDEVRERLGWSKKTVISVGNLVELKGHDLVVRAMVNVPNANLIIIGDGPEYDRLRLLIDKLGLADRVCLAGSMGKDKLLNHYQAADVLVLASSREGFANVLLEAAACGTPVVATRVGGNPEMVDSETAGLLVSRNEGDIAYSINKLFLNKLGRSATRRHAERFGWEATCLSLYELFSRVSNRV